MAAMKQGLRLIILFVLVGSMGTGCVHTNVRQTSAPKAGVIVKIPPVNTISLSSAEKERLDKARRLTSDGKTFYLLGSYNKAVPLFKEALDIMREILGVNHPYMVDCLENLAFAYEGSGNHGMAEKLFQRALAIDSQEEKSTLAASTPRTTPRPGSGRQSTPAARQPALARAQQQQLARAQQQQLARAAKLNSRVVTLYEQGKYQEAILLARESLAIVEKALGPDHPGTATDLNNLAGLYDSLGAYSKAEPLYKRALAIDEKALGPDHPDTASSLNSLALLYCY